MNNILCKFDKLYLPNGISQLEDKEIKKYITLNKIKEYI